MQSTETDSRKSQHVDFHQERARILARPLEEHKLRRILKGAVILIWREEFPQDSQNLLDASNIPDDILPDRHADLPGDAQRA